MKDGAMDCDHARSLIEKLADDEASEPEVREAQAHLAGCASCRSDSDLLVAVARAFSRPLPEPPEGYFRALPNRILARIDASAASPVVSAPFWKRIVAPGALRWQALAAVLVMAVALGLVARREGLLDPSPAPASQMARPRAPSTLEEQDRPAEEAVPEAVEDRSLTSPVSPQASTPAPPAEPPVARDRRERAQLEQDAAAAAAPEPEEVFTENALEITEAPGASGRASARAAPASSIAKAANDCERWRRALDELVPESEQASEARFRLARCSIDRFRSEGTEALRQVAIAEGVAFLSLEPEGARAEEIREALEALR